MSATPPKQYGQTLWEEIQVPGVVPLLAEIRDDLAAISQRLEAVAGALAAIPTATAGSPSSGTRLPIPLPALNLPLSPIVLNEMINAANMPGVSKLGAWKLTVNVPAGQTVVVSVPVLPGTVTVFAAPMKVTATYYSANITADVLVDGYDITPYPEYALTGDDQIEFGQYYYMRIGMQGTITNNTATNTLITFGVEVMAIQRDFFETFYRPLIEYSVDTLKSLAELVLAAKGGQA